MKKTTKKIKLSLKNIFFLAAAGFLSILPVVGMNDQSHFTENKINTVIFPEIIRNEQGHYKFKSPFDRMDESADLDWKNIGVRLGINDNDWSKVNKGYYLTKNVVLGNLIYRKYQNEFFLMSPANQISALVQAADNGCEYAIVTLLSYCGYSTIGMTFGSDFHLPIEIGRIFARKYAESGSEYAISMLLNDYLYGWFGLDFSNPDINNEGLALSQKYKDLGSQTARNMLSSFFEKIQKNDN